MMIMMMIVCSPMVVSFCSSKVLLPGDLTSYAKRTKETFLGGWCLPAACVPWIHYTRACLPTSTLHRHHFLAASWSQPSLLLETFSNLSVLQLDVRPCLSYWMCDGIMSNDISNYTFPSYLLLHIAWQWLHANFNLMWMFQWNED